MVTAYDYPSAQVVEEAGVDIVLVGDSGAMTVLGYDSTVPVGMDEMLMLAAAVRRGLRTPLLVGDMPFGSYEGSNEQAVANAQRFIKEAGCDAVKLERGGASVDRARAIVRAGIPVMGHVGLTPQTATALGGFKAQGTTAEPRRRDRRGGARAAGRGLLLDRVRGGAGGRHRGADAEDGGPGDRDRRRRGDRRPGAGLPRPARHPRGHAAKFVKRYADDPRGDGRRASRRTPPTSARAPSRARSTSTAIEPAELAEFRAYLDQESMGGGRSGTGPQPRSELRVILENACRSGGNHTARR